MNSATDTIRAMLDELGVEWETNDRYTARWLTRWKSNGIEWSAEEEGMALLLKTVDGIEPEQAIEATLGRGECYVKAAKKIGDLFGFSLSCGHSMVNPFDDRPDYCPWCGRKVRA